MKLILSILLVSLSAFADERVVISWKSVTNATGYNVWITDGAGDWNKLCTTTETNFLTQPIATGLYGFSISSLGTNCFESKKGTIKWRAIK